jgi:hypothetical protein
MMMILIYPEWLSVSQLQSLHKSQRLEEVERLAAAKTRSENKFFFD